MSADWTTRYLGKGSNRDYRDQNRWEVSGWLLRKCKGGMEKKTLKKKQNYHQVIKEVKYCSHATKCYKRNQQKKK